MPRRIALAWVVVAGFTTSAPAQVSSQHRILPTRSSLARIGLEKLWYTAVPLVNSEVVTITNLAEDMLFVQTSMGNVHAYEAESGKYLWGANNGAPTLDARPVAVNSDQVFVTNNRTLHCLDRKTGRSIWVANLGVTVSNPAREGATAVGAPAATESRVMVGLAGGKLVAYSTRPTPAVGKFMGRSAGSLAWTWQTNGPMVARPIPADRVVAFASEDKKVYVCQDSPPTLLFRYLTAGPITASMGTHGTRTLIVPSQDQILYALDLYTGETRWTVSTGASLEREPLVEGDTIYIINTAGEVFAIDAVSGTILWSARTGGIRLVALGTSRLYVDTKDHDVLILDRKMGRILSNSHETRERAGVDLREYTIGFTNRQNDRLYFATPSGSLLALREAGSMMPKLLRDPKAKRFGYLPPEGGLAAPTPPASPAADAPAADAPPAETPPPEADKPPGGDQP